MGSDFSRQRFAVEKEKMSNSFPGFSFYVSGGEYTSVKGYLKTNYQNRYYVKINIPSGYPHSIPKIWIEDGYINSSCPHRYNSGNLCVMKTEQWTSVYSLAFMVARAAIWLNKYDIWNQSGRWPGNDQDR